MPFETVGSPLLWIGFTVFVILMLALDLGVFHRKAHIVSTREALTWSCVWVSLALVFNAGVYFYFGSEKGTEFLTGFLIEKALSIDNIFVILVTFTLFSIPQLYQHKVLFWGILGALIFRAIFIFLGATIIQNFHSVMYVFAAILIYTAIKLMKEREEDPDPEKNFFYRFFRKIFPTTNGLREDHFFVKENGKWLATPLFLALLTVEISDVIFAVESIPAIFAITQDPFIVYTSNIFAILGMRSLFFLLSGVMGKFHYLKIGLSLVLGFVGLKIIVSGFYKIPVFLSLGVVAFLIGGSIVLSLLKPVSKKYG